MRYLLILLILLATPTLLYLVYCLNAIFTIFRDSRIPEDPKDPRRRFWYIHLFLWYTIRAPLAAVVETLAEVADAVSRGLLRLSEWIG